MSISFEECRALLVEHKARHEPTPKRFEMSAETEHHIVARLPLLPTNERALTLWGIPYTINNSLADGEIRPIYA